MDCDKPAKNVDTAGSQGALDLTNYRLKKALAIALCYSLPGLALSTSPGRKAVESAYSLGKQALSLSGQCGKTVLSTLWPGTQYVKIPIYVVYESGKALVVEGYKSGKVNAIHYGKLGYNSGGYIGGYLGPIVGFSIEQYVLSSIPAPVDGTFSLMTPSVEAIIGSTLMAGMNARRGTMGDSLKKLTTDMMQGTKDGDVRELRAVVYAHVGKGCGQIIGCGLGAAWGFVVGGIAGVMAIPEGIRKGVENACKDACNLGQKPTQSGDVM